MPLSLIAGWLVVALADAAVLAARMPTDVPFRVRVLTHVYSGGHLLALGLVLVVLVVGWLRFAPRAARAPRVLWPSLVAASWLATWLVMGEDLSGLADSLAKTTALRAQPAWMALLTFGASLTVPLTILLGRQLGRRLGRSRLWPLGVALGAAAAAANGMEHDYPDIHLIVTPSYPGAHVLVAVLAALLAGLSLGGSRWLARRLEGARPGALDVGRALLATWAAFAIVTWPGNAVGLQLERHRGAVLLTFLGPLHTTEVEQAPPRIPEAQRAWFVDRSSAPAVGPSGAAGVLPADPIILLLSIDSMRADLLADEQYRDELPTLFRLRDTSVFFENAWAAGSSTAPSFTALFAGKHYSQMYWTRGETNDSLVYPHRDMSVRFPALLTEAGVATYNHEGVGWLDAASGIAPGFAVEKSLRKRGFPRAKTLLEPVLDVLKDRPKGPQLFFIHLLDAHSPYGGAGQKATPFLGYVGELGLVDAQVGALLAFLKKERLLARTAIVMIADHGEAFGEHGGLRRHGVSLYDELLRVPMLIHAPGVAPRVVKQQVSLLDVGPTLLDLFGVKTPGHFMGQSLGGFLKGETPELTRPIAAEGRLERAMITPDRHKVIHDTRTHVVEVYDLARDPGELINLYDEDDPEMVARAVELDTFFRVHTLKRPGYRVPYRKW